MSQPNTDQDVITALEAALSTAGRDKVLQTLSALAEIESQESNILTIIMNEGVHYLPDEYKRGEVFVASQGSFDLSSHESVHEEFWQVLRATARKLKSRAWKRVYIVPFGPTPLSMQVKLLVYRVCGIESIEVMQVSGGLRLDVSIPLRELIVKSDAAR